MVGGEGIGAFWVDALFGVCDGGDKTGEFNEWNIKWDIKYSLEIDGDNSFGICSLCVCVCFGGVMKIEIAKLVGKSNNQMWAQVHSFFPEGEKRKWGALVAAVGLRLKEEEVDLAAVGGEIIKRLHESYYGSGDGASLEHLKETLRKINEEFSNGLEVTLVCGVMQTTAEIFYGAVLGKGRVMLRREGELVVLLGGYKVASSREIEGVSGHLKEDDVVILGSEDLFTAFEEGETWKAIGSLKQVEAMVDQVAPWVHRLEEAVVAGVFVGIEREAEQGDEIEAVGAEEESPSESLRQRVKNTGFLSRRSVSQMTSRVWLGLKRFRVRQTSEVVRTEEEVKERRRKLIGTVAILLMMLLLMSLGFAQIKQRTSVESRAFEEVKEIVELKTAESKSLKDINNLRARTLLLEAEQIVSEYKRREGRYKKSEEWINAKQAELEVMIAQLIQIKQVEGGVFLDLNLVREGSSGSEMDFDGENLLVLDSQAEVVLAIKIDSKKAEVVGGGDLLRGATLTAVYFKRGFVVSDRGVVELDLKNKTSAVVIDSSGDNANWGEIGQIDVFGGNLYLLDKGKSEIYRYRGIEGGFGTKQDWLGAGVGPDYSKVVSMAIDGSIWLMTESGKIERYTQGTGKVVEILGLDKPFSEAEAIYADEESEWVYILDKGNSRVVRINKEGEYESQWRWDRLSEMTDMVVSEKAGKILLLGESTIYEIEIDK